MKYMREHRPPSKRAKTPDVWKILALLYQPSEECNRLQLERSKVPITQVMKQCKCSRWTVNRVLRACEEGGKEAVLALKWGAGPPAMPAPSAAEIEWLVDPSTLRRQAHLSLQQRAGVFNQQFDQDLGAQHVRAIYRHARVSKQRFRSATGPPKPTAASLAKQQVYLDAAREKLERLTEKGYDIFQCDACVFSADSFVPSAWAAQGQPPAIPHKWTSKKYVAVFAAISERSGCLLQMYKLGEAFKAKDIDDFLQQLRLRAGKHRKLAVFWDNASIHRAPGSVTAPQLGIEVIRNAPYRPDLNGIEFFWRSTKMAYRKEITRLRSQNIYWDQVELVKAVVRDAGFPCARDCAS